MTGPTGPRAAPDPGHPLFAGLAGAEVTRLAVTRGPAGDHAVELTLQSPAVGDERTFRFDGVPWLRAGNRFPEVGWLQVHDVSARGLDRLAVRVSDGEQTEALEFWAAAVVEVGQAGAGAPAS